MREAKEQTRDAKVGLCADCAHAKRIASDRESVFWMCQLSATDSRFAKYPRLPVLSCEGYVQTSRAAKSTDHTKQGA